MKIYTLEVPITSYRGNKLGHVTENYAYQVNINTIEGTKVVPWWGGAGGDEERGDYVWIMFQNWQIACQINDSGVVELIRAFETREEDRF